MSADLGDAADRSVTLEDFNKSVESLRVRLRALPNGRERSIALTNLDTAHLWGTKAIMNPEPQK